MHTLRVTELDLNNKRDVKSFINLPYNIYEKIPQWIPPLRHEMALTMNLRKNPYFADSTAAFFLVFNEKTQPIGRIACLNNKRFNDFNHKKTAFFTLFESYDVPEAAELLFSKAMDWARKQGLNEIIGPKGFSPLDGIGMLIKGFEYQPAYGIPYNPDWYPKLVENAGFSPFEDIFSGYLEKGYVVDPKIRLIAKRVKERSNIKVLAFKNRKDLLAMVPKMLDLYNRAIEGTENNYPITRREADSLLQQFFWLADLSLIKIITKEKQPIGFLFAYPDVSDAVKKINGKLFPFGWIQVLKGLKTSTVVDINGMGMIKEYRGSGGTAILFDELVKSDQPRFTRVEIVQIGEKNVQMLRELLNFQIKWHKTHRLYSRLL